ncbi:MAG: hypothetical protein BroJett030_33780 [Alphaproteobacteria bacterium]|nr:MAG: hypothetical protein BroJett030_33780 [Alphaproteobacteria bacterium]
MLLGGGNILSFAGWHAVAACCIWLAAAAPADADRGERLFGECKACHDIGANARHKVGPHLDGVIGRVAGSVDGFRYSSAMVAAGRKGLVWTAATIDAYIVRPREFIPGNRMSFRGMADAGDRAALTGWIEATSTARPADDPNAPVAVADEATSFTDIVLKMKGDPEYGEYLAGECVTCHQQSGRADGIPSIVGLPAPYFIRALFEYKTNVRSNEVMKLRVQNLGNDEIAALAAYFSSLEPR